MNTSVENGNRGSAQQSSDPHNQLVSGKKLLELLFDEESRPTVRWLHNQQKARTIPYVKIGALVFFNPDQVRKTLESRQR